MQMCVVAKPFLPPLPQTAEIRRDGSARNMEPRLLVRIFLYLILPDISRGHGALNE